MKISVKYMAQLKQAAGVPAEEIELEQPCSPAQLVQLLAERHGESLRRLLLGEGGQLQPTILMFVNDTQIKGDEERPLQDGDEVAFLSPIAGG